MLKCSKCNREIPQYTNVKYKLCLSCNHNRLHPEMKGEIFSEDQWEQIKKDDETYKQVWDSKEHICEECGESLGEELYDEEGKIAARWRFSHILGKKAYPEFRNDPRNFNLLCYQCHSLFEFGNKKEMNIYEGDMEIIEILLNERNNRA